MKRKNFDYKTHVKFLPPRVQPIFTAVSYLQSEVNFILQAKVKDSIKIGKINFWRDNIKEIFAGTVQQEPLSILLSSEIKSLPIPSQPFLMYLDSVQKEVEQPQCDGLEDFQIRC